MIIDKNMKSNFFKRLLSAIIFIPLIIIPIIIEGYILVFIYLTLLTLIVLELINITYEYNFNLYGFIYIFISVFSLFTFIILIISSDSNIQFILTILMIWLFDTFSYLGGSLFKGKKIFPKISKGKTYSGLISGYVSLIIFYFIYKIFFIDLHSISISYIFLIATLAFIGDFNISFIKRLSLIKDSGTIMPGHGGLLDRMDSFIFVFFIIGAFELIRV